MKFNVLDIILKHLASMITAGSPLAKIGDITCIFVVPIAVGIISCLVLENVDSSFYGVSVSVFAVFSALLLNTQIAIFGIYGRTPERPANEKQLPAFESRLKLRNSLIAELNVNVSYLMVFAVFSLFVFGIFYVFSLPRWLEILVAISIYTHFSVTMIVVIKRSHALFAHEYS